MKKLAFLIILSALAFGCENAAKPVAQSNSSSPAGSGNEKPQTAIAHSSEDQTSKPVPPSGEKSKWSQSGDPIDTKKFDAVITAAEKALASKPSDASAKRSLANAYFERGVALTDARQYASALGDYRRAIKYDPSNTEAKDWIDKIVMIYDGLGKAYPKEGEEPPALPFAKPK